VYVARITGTGVCTLTFDGGAPVYDGDQYTATSEANGQAAIGLVPLGSGENWLVASVFPAAGGSGDVVGPASAVDDRIATFDTATGKLLQDGGKTIAELVPKSLYDANTILAATSDDTLVALTVGASRIVGRKASGDIAALTGAEVLAIGSGQAAADFAWNSHKLTGVTAGAATGEVATYEQLAAKAPLLGRPYTAGLYYGPDTAVPYVGTKVTANLYATRRFFAPFTPVATTTFDRIAVGVEGLTSLNARIGIWAPGSDGLPATLVLDAGTVACATGTNASSERVVTISQSLTGGTRYWLSIEFDITNTAGLWCVPVASMQPIHQITSSQVGYYGAGGSCVYKDIGSFGALASTVSALTVTNNVPTPGIGLRAS